MHFLSVQVQYIKNIGFWPLCTLTALVNISLVHNVHPFFSYSGSAKLQSLISELSKPALPRWLWIIFRGSPGAVLPLPLLFCLSAGWLPLRGKSTHDCPDSVAAFRDAPSSVGWFVLGLFVHGVSCPASSFAALLMPPPPTGGKIALQQTIKSLCTSC